VSSSENVTANVDGDFRVPVDGPVEEHVAEHSTMAPRKSMSTKTRRVYDALRARGDQGITRDDFTGNTIDGGPEIRSLTAEITRLRLEHDQPIVFNRRGGNWHLTTPEKAAKRPRRRQSKKGPKERPYTPGSRAQELKERAEKDPGDYSRWLAKRKSVVNFARNVAQMEPMIFWKHAPDDEMIDVIEELLDAYEAVTRALAAVHVRLDDEETRATIAKMIDNTKGRTKHEIATAKKLAARKRAKADISYLS
jgi:hypothetical protein